VNFTGLQKNSFIDYPEKISCVLFFSGCNFKCPYCHNPETVNSNLNNSALINESMIYDFLKKRKGFLDGVVISGGEPTLCKDLFLLCNNLKQMDFKVKLDTNGSKPIVIKTLIDEGLIDYIAMDIKTDPANYSLLMPKGSKPNNILSSIKLIMKSKIDYEFRTTCVKPFIDENIIKNIAHIIQGSKLYALQRFNENKVLDPEFFKDKDCGFNDIGLLNLQTIAKQWVKLCIIR